MHLTRTTAENADFRRLVAQLDEYLAEVDGEDHAYYAQFNGLDSIPHVVVAFEENVPVACGAFKPFDSGSVEIKRMFTMPEHRGKRIAELVLTELETWAAEIGFTDCVLETGHRQQAAVTLYRRSGYEVIPNYGQYVGIDDSVCMKKTLARTPTVVGA